MKKLNVAIVGLSFGLEFVPIYLEHPDVESLTLVETNVNLLRTVQERYGIPDENCFPIPCCFFLIFLWLGSLCPGSFHMYGFSGGFIRLPLLSKKGNHFRKWILGER